MKKLVVASWMSLLLLPGGCGMSHNDVVAGNEGVKSGQFFGNVGIVGRGNRVVVERGSRLWKYSIAGDNNTVEFEEGTTLNKLELWGQGNVVSVPENMVFRVNEVGNNQIIRRPVTKAVVEEPAPLGPLPELPPRRPPQVRERPAPPPPPPAREEPVFLPPAPTEPPLK